MRQASVTAPKEALPTWRAYFARTPRVSRGLGAFHFAWRFFHSAAEMARSICRVSASISIRSPFLTHAIGPPTAASGERCPTTNPWLPPENRPSVINATS